MQFVKGVAAGPTASESTGQPVRKSASLATLRRVWQEHGIALVVYMGLSIGLTWPLIRDFTTAVTGGGDARHHLWILWHADWHTMSKYDVLVGLKSCQQLRCFAQITTIERNTICASLGWKRKVLYLKHA